ncbi:MAG TPA: DedA family protein [Microbacteriaceae bacterium]|nr:DedA family protein [Microbacteriaceae bacterium]
MVVAAALSTQLTDVFSHVGIIVFYLIVWGLVFAGTGLFVGAFIPFITGDSLLFAAGLVAAASDRANIWILAIGVGLAAFVGDQVGFVFGRHLGRPYLDRKSGPRMQRIIDRVDRFYHNYGWWSVVIARFIPWARVFVPWVAGIGRMNYYAFLTANIVGALAWGVGLVFVGYFAASIPAVKSLAYVIAGIMITLSLIFGFRTWLAERRERALGSGTE